MARAVKKTPRLPSGLYVRRGRAVPFSKLSKSQQHAWRSHWSKKANATQKALAFPPKARELKSKARKPAKPKLPRDLRRFRELARRAYQDEGDSSVGGKYLNALDAWIEEQDIEPEDIDPAWRYYRG